LDREKYIIDKYKCVGESPHVIELCKWKQLPYLLKDMGCKVGAEIGVEKGQFAETLLRKIPELKLYAVDCWEPYSEYREGKNYDINQYYQRALEKLTPFGDRVEIIKKYSMDALADVPDESLDFVYIDANHEFQHAVNDIAEWSKKVKKGGVISGHDFVHTEVQYEKMEVEDAVRGWTSAKKIDPWFIAVRGERMPNWLYIKH